MVLLLRDSEKPHVAFTALLSICLSPVRGRRLILSSSLPDVSLPG